MNWNQFIFYLLVVYFIYYLLNILLDLLRAKPMFAENSGQEELTFSEDHQPETVVENDVRSEEKKTMVASTNRQSISSGPIHTTGAVSLKQLFSLAQSDLIEFTKAIPY